MDFSKIILEEMSPEKKKKFKKLAIGAGLALAAAGGAHYGYKKYKAHKEAEKEYNRPINKFKRKVSSMASSASEKMSSASHKFSEAAKSAISNIGNKTKSVGRSVKAHVTNALTVPTSKVEDGKLVEGPRKLRKFGLKSGVMIYSKN